LATWKPKRLSHGWLPGVCQYKCHCDCDSDSPGWARQQPTSESVTLLELRVASDSTRTWELGIVTVTAAAVTAWQPVLVTVTVTALAAHKGRASLGPAAGHRARTQCSPPGVGVSAGRTTRAGHSSLTREAAGCPRRPAGVPVRRVSLRVSESYGTVPAVTAGGRLRVR
jgi:hypothetical protein